MSLRLLTGAERVMATLLLMKYGIEVEGGEWIMRSAWDDDVPAEHRRLVASLFEEQRYSIPDE